MTEGFCCQIQGCFLPPGPDREGLQKLAARDSAAQPTWLPKGPGKAWKSRGRGHEAGPCPCPVERSLAVSAFWAGSKDSFGAVIVAPSWIRTSNPCGPPRDASKLCRRFPPLLHLPIYLCVCVLLHSLTVCPLRVTTINIPSHEPSHMMSRSVPMHRGGQMTFLSSWRIVILPSLPRVRLALPLLPRGRPAQLAGCVPRTELPGRQRRSPRAATVFIPILETAPAPEGIIFLACDGTERLERKIREPGFKSQLPLPSWVAWGKSVSLPGLQLPHLENGHNGVTFPQIDTETFGRVTHYT